MKIAIIGSGISGLASAYLLNQQHDITLYEKNPTLGGHSRTIDISVDGTTIPVDTGFIVFNKRNYPLLTGLFEHLNVPIALSDMSFGTSVESGRIEYGSKGLFAQKKNLLSPKFWGMVFDILRFNRQALRHLDRADAITLGQLLDQLKMGDWFRRYYLQAMGAAIWSCSVDTILEFPAKSFLRFFDNHGLLTVNGHPQWYTVKGGSREYIKRITAGFADKIKLDCGAMSVMRTPNGVVITDTKNETHIYDRVVFACHSDQALKLLTDPSDAERDVLSGFSYQPNNVIVHGDVSFMPRERKAWASWVYLSENAQDRKPVVSLSYWMNNLQPLNTDKPVIITLNPERQPDPKSVYDRHAFSHPVFTLRALRSQNMIDTIQHQNSTSYCGAYQRYGFHEDGILSAVTMAKGLGATPPWL